MYRIEPQRNQITIHWSTALLQQSALKCSTMLQVTSFAGGIEWHLKFQSSFCTLHRGGYVYAKCTAALHCEMITQLMDRDEGHLISWWHLGFGGTALVQIVHSHRSWPMTRLHRGNDCDVDMRNHERCTAIVSDLIVTPKYMHIEACELY